MKFLGLEIRKATPIPEAIQEATPIPEAMVSDLLPYVGTTSWNGDKFYSGFGITKDFEVVDYWLLRKRSKQLFTENLYARGIIRRLITNEINKGLALEATPDADILGLDLDEISKWSENIERRFFIWGKRRELSDYRQLRTFGEIQQQARMMALVSGDVLIVLRQGATGLPNVDLIDADCIENPIDTKTISAVTSRGNKICHGVEVDKAGRHVAFFVRQEDYAYARIPAYGEKTGRKQAWLFYGTEKQIDEIRGQSILALVLQSLKEIDRYRDAEQRAAVVNSMIALWVEKTEDKMGTLPLTGGAVRKDTYTTQNDSQGRKDVQFSTNMPGMMLQELAHGEKPTSYDTKRPNVNFGAFEAAIVSAISWGLEIPPEVLTLGFENNYSASRGAVNELKMYLEKARDLTGNNLCAPIYEDFLLSEALKNNIKADGFLKAWQDPSRWDEYGAWTLSDWAGAIKPNVDLLKEVRAYIELVEQGWITRDRAARELTGMKFSKVVQQLSRENPQLIIALQPLLNAGLLKNENQMIEPQPIDEEN